MGIAVLKMDKIVLSDIVTFLHAIGDIESISFPPFFGDQVTIRVRTFLVPNGEHIRSLHTTIDRDVAAKEVRITLRLVDAK